MYLCLPEGESAQFGTIHHCPWLGHAICGKLENSCGIFSLVREILMLFLASLGKSLVNWTRLDILFFADLWGKKVDTFFWDQLLFNTFLVLSVFLD